MRSPTYGGSDYLGDAPQLRTTDDGFQTVGDMGYLDDDGYLYIVDRRVDMIITGGANVFPAEVEAALIDHPKIADVVVIGLKDDEWGRRVHAIVEPADPADPADGRRGDRLRQGPARRLQGAQDGRARRRDPAERGHQGRTAAASVEAPRWLTQPFDGVRVVELAQWVFVPVAGALLADWGADVIRDRPARGRPLPRPRHPGHRHRQRRASTSPSPSPTGASGRSRSTCAPTAGKRGPAPPARDAPTCSSPASGPTPSSASGSAPTRSGAATRGWSTPAATATASAAPTPACPATTPRRSGPAAASATCSPHPSATTRSRSGAPSATATAAWRWPSASPPPCSGGATTGEGSVVDVSLLATAMWTLSSDVLSALQGADATGRRRAGRWSTRWWPPTAPRTGATSSSSSSSPTATGRRSAS